MTFFTGYLALGVGISRFVEASDPGYQRAAVNMVAVGNAGFAITGTVTNGSQTLGTQLALFDAPNAGNLIMWWQLPAPVLLASAFAALNSFAVPSLQLSPLTNTFATATGLKFPAGSTLGYASNGSAVVAGTSLAVNNGVLAAVSANASTMPTPVNANASGTYTLSFASAGDICYIINLTGNTTFAVNPVTAANGYQRIFLYINPNGFTPTLPSSNGTVLENVGGSPPSVTAGTLSTTQLSEYVYSTYGTTIFGGAT